MRVLDHYYNVKLQPWFLIIGLSKLAHGGSYSVYHAGKIKLTTLADLRGEARGHAPPQDARGDEVTLSTKDFSVQFYTKCASK